MESLPNPGNNIVTLARKAGYETWWISNQGSLGQHDTLISVIAANADKKHFLKEGSSSSLRIDDEDMLQYVREAVNCKRRLSTVWQILKFLRE